MSEEDQVDENLFGDLRTYFKFERRLGFMFYEIKNGDQLTFTGTAKLMLMIYSVVYTILAVEILRLYATSIVTFLELLSIMEKLVSILYVAFDLSFIFAEWILNKVYNKSTLDMLNKFCRIEKDLKKIGISVRYVLKDRWIWILSFYLAVSMMHSITIVIVDYLSVGNILSSLYRTFLFLFFNLTHISFTSKFTNTLCITKDILKAINRNFIKKFSNVLVADEMIVKEELKNLKMLSKIYQDVFGLLRDFNEMVSIRMLLLFAMFFCWITVHIFNFVTVIAASGFAYEYSHITIFSLSSMLYATTYFGSFVLTCEAHYKEVSALKLILFKAVSQVQVEQLRKEINIISLQISHEDYEIKTAGLFVINMKLVASIVSAITTYTIVLMQYNPNAGVFQEYMHDHLL